MTSDASRPPHNVSARHLSEALPWLSEFEFGLTVATQAFHTWMVRCMAAAGASELAPNDILILHHVRHEGREKRLAEICAVLHMGDDPHTASYALRKLVQLGLVQSQRRGKEAAYSVTDQGSELCEAYARIRQRHLIEAVRDRIADGERGGELARLLHLLAGAYDQATRMALAAPADDH